MKSSGGKISFYIIQKKMGLCIINPGGLRLTTELCKNLNQKDFAHQHLHERNACKSTFNMQRQQPDTRARAHLCQQAQPPLTLELGTTCASGGDDCDALAAPRSVLSEGVCRGFREGGRAAGTALSTPLCVLLYAVASND